MAVFGTTEIKDVGFQEPPYTVSRELIEQFRQATPSELKGIIEDLFETITLFDNHAVAATYKQHGGEHFEVTVSVASHKFRVDELGVEKEVPIDVNAMFHPRMGAPQSYLAQPGTNIRINIKTNYYSIFQRF